MPILDLILKNSCVGVYLSADYDSASKDKDSCSRMSFVIDGSYNIENGRLKVITGPKVDFGLPKIPQTPLKGAGLHAGIRFQPLNPSLLTREVGISFSTNRRYIRDEVTFRTFTVRDTSLKTHKIISIGTLRVQNDPADYLYVAQGVSFVSRADTVSGRYKQQDIRYVYRIPEDLNDNRKEKHSFEAENLRYKGKVEHFNYAGHEFKQLKFELPSHLYHKKNLWKSQEHVSLKALSNKRAHRAYTQSIVEPIVSVERTIWRPLGFGLGLLAILAFIAIFHACKTHVRPWLNKRGYRRR